MAAGEICEVLCATSATAEPTARAFDDPALRNNLEAFCRVRALNDLEWNARHRFDGCSRCRPLIAAIGQRVFFVHMRAAKNRRVHATIESQIIRMTQEISGRPLNHSASFPATRSPDRVWSCSMGRTTAWTSSFGWRAMQRGGPLCVLASPPRYSPIVSAQRLRRRASVRRWSRWRVIEPPAPPRATSKVTPAVDRTHSTPAAPRQTPRHVAPPP